jgi:hypothetical protein
MTGRPDRIGDHAKAALAIAVTRRRALGVRLRLK